MKILASFILSLALFLSLTIQVSAGGGGKGGSKAGSGTGDNGWSSSGGDDLPLSLGAAWFLGADPINACIIRAEDYSKSEQELKKLIVEGSSTWIRYYTDMILAHQTYYLRKVHPSMAIKFLSTCDNAELKFIFGERTPEVVKESQKYFNPFAFATLQSYDVKLQRGKGFIWFSDPEVLFPEANHEALKGLIIHELGHVFGSPHVAGTIMDQDIAKTILFKASAVGNFPTDYFLQTMSFIGIEMGQRPFYFSRRSKWSYYGYVVSDNSKSKADFINYLLGSEVIVGNQTGVNAHIFNKPESNEYFLEIGKGKKQKKIFSIEIAGQGSIIRRNELFRMLVEDPKTNESYIDAITAEGFEIFGHLIDQNGVRYAAVISLNLGELDPIQFKVFHKNEVFNLFELDQNPNHSLDRGFSP